MKKLTEVMEIRNMIKVGNLVTVTDKNWNVLTKKVVSVEWYKIGGFRIEFTGGYSWIEEQDGGQIDYIEGNRVKKVNDAYYVAEEF